MDLPQKNIIPRMKKHNPIFLNAKQTYFNSELHIPYNAVAYSVVPDCREQVIRLHFYIEFDLITTHSEFKQISPTYPRFLTPLSFTIRHERVREYAIPTPVIQHT